MANEYKINARNKKEGMSLAELMWGIAEIPTIDKQYTLKANIGFKGQLQSLTLIEVDDDVPEA